jgi:hypothetical protein
MYATTLSRGQRRTAVAGGWRGNRADTGSAPKRGVSRVGERLTVDLRT